MAGPSPPRCAGGDKSGSAAAGRALGGGRAAMQLTGLTLLLLLLLCTGAAAGPAAGRAGTERRSAVGAGSKERRAQFASWDEVNVIAHGLLQLGHGLKEHVDRTKGQMRELGSRLSAHNSSMGRLLRQAREAQERGERLRASVRELEGRGRQLLNLSEALRQRLEEVAADKAQIQGRLEQLEGRVRQVLQARPVDNQSAKDLGALQVRVDEGGGTHTTPAPAGGGGGGPTQPGTGSDPRRGGHGTRPPGTHPPPVLGPGWGEAGRGPCLAGSGRGRAMGRGGTPDPPREAVVGSSSPGTQWGGGGRGQSGGMRGTRPSWGAGSSVWGSASGRWDTHTDPKVLGVPGASGGTGPPGSVRYVQHRRISPELRGSPGSSPPPSPPPLVPDGCAELANRGALAEDQAAAVQAGQAESAN